jgi:hypothetical protein
MLAPIGRTTSSDEVGDERERGQGVDPAQATQTSHMCTPWLLLGRLADRPFQLLDPCVVKIDRVQVGIEGDLPRCELEALLGKPVTAAPLLQAERTTKRPSLTP